MGLYPIRNLVQLSCRVCEAPITAKRVDTKYCPLCREVMKLKHSNESRNRRRSEVNRQSRERNKNLSPQQRQRRLEVQRKNRWKNKFGLTEKDFNQMLQDQNNSCAICTKLLDKPFVDHDHVTHKVRGLLCNNCNFGIGSLQDDPQIIARAQAYVLAGHNS